MELTDEELVAESIGVWVLRENTPSTSLNVELAFKESTASSKDLSVIRRICIWNFVLRENIYLTKICCDLSHLELCRVHWNCVHIYGLFKLTSNSILCGERYSNSDWFLFTCGFVTHSVVWERLDRFVLGENIG